MGNRTNYRWASLMLIGAACLNCIDLSVSYSATAVPLSNATGTPWSGDTSLVADNVINDTFTYNPNLLYEFPGSLDPVNIPDTGFGSGTFFSEPTDADNFWQVDVALSGGDTLDFIDIWGRTDGAPGEDGRFQDLVLTFFDGTGGTGSTLGVSSPFDPVGINAAGIPGGSYGRFDVSALLNPTQAAQVQSFRIDHSPGSNEFLLLQEVRAGTGIPVNPNPALLIDRGTGVGTLTNGDTAATVLGYQITSGVGALDPASWISIADTADGNSGGSLDSDIWVEIGGANNISESELPGGDGGFAFGASQALGLGSIWGKHPDEDVELTLLFDDGSTLDVATVFTGNGGNAFPEGDFNFDNSVDLADYAKLRDGLSSDLSGLAGFEAYALGDLDGDGDTDISDFRAFEALYDAANPLSLVQALAAVPEPSTAVLLGFACLGFICRRPTSTRFSNMKSMYKKTVYKKNLLLLAVVFAVAFCDRANAQTFTVVNAPSNPASDVSENNAFNANFGAANMFDSTVSAADLNVTDYNGVDTEFAALGSAPVGVFVDNNSSITTNWIAYSQRGATLDHVGTIEVWFSDTDFGGVVPTTAADAVVDIDDRVNPGVLKTFSLNATLTGRYSAMRFTRAPGATANIGGREFRFLQGPDAFTLEVDTTTGELTLKNNSSLAQSLDIDSYEITSASGSLSSTGFTGLAGQAGFPAASAEDAGDGWELNAASAGTSLGETYLLGGSTVNSGSSLSLGDGFSGGAEDLVFRYSLDDGVLLTGLVEYVASPVTADFDSDTDVDGADFLTWQRNAGITSGATPSQGDATGDGAVDAADLAEWNSQYGVGGGPLGAVSAVPEPSAIALVLLGGAASLLVRRTS